MSLKQRWLDIQQMHEFEVECLSDLRWASKNSLIKTKTKLFDWVKREIRELYWYWDQTERSVEYSITIINEYTNKKIELSDSMWIDCKNRFDIDKVLSEMEKFMRGYRIKGIYYNYIGCDYFSGKKFEAEIYIKKMLKFNV